MKGLYVHIPFCIKKCKYCDFNSFTFSCEDKKSYLVALFQQMELYKGEKVDGVSDQDLNEFGKDTRGYTVKQYRILKDTYKDQDTVYILIDIEVKRYSITYDYNGGVIDPAARSNPKTTYRLSDSIDLLKTAPAVRDGYVHVGWAESPNATVDECIKNTKDCADNPRNLVLYAIYVPAE